jgi:ABC-type multidrug transport system fused ATPase/permease subunit
MSERRHNLAKILAFAYPYRTRLLGLMALTVLLSVLAMLPPLITRAIIDKVLTEGRRELFTGLAVCMFVMPLVMAVCYYIQSLGIAQVGQRFVFDIRIALYHHMLGLSLRFYGKHSAGKLVNRLMGDSGTVQQMLTGQTINVISDLVCAAFAVTATFAINWRLATLLALIVLIFVLNYRFNIHRIRRASRSSWSAMDRLSGGVQNRLVANVAVKTFGAEERENTVFQRHSDNTLEFGREAMVAGSNFSLNTNLIQNLGRSLIYFLGCAMVLSGDLTYGDVIAFTTYAMQLLMPAVRFSELARQIQQVGIATERLFEIFDEIPEIRNDPHPLAVSHLEGRVDFNNVYFEYEKGRPVIRGLDLHVDPGQTIALIGPTGCGKSTVLALLLRFYDIRGGELLIDGVDIRKYDLHSFRRHFGIVLQEPLLFSTTIAENIRYGRPAATREEIEAAARVAEIHDFIMGLAKGYDTFVGDYGVELSVGQKQRINIARAVAANPAILIMDEATSSLDSDSERAIQKAMDRVLQGRTSFVVAHRLSTIRNADKIVLLDQGRIAEMGRHDELMDMPDGRYHDLYTKHMGAGVLTE